MDPGLVDKTKKAIAAFYVEQDVQKEAESHKSSTGYDKSALSNTENKLNKSPGSWQSRQELQLRISNKERGDDPPEKLVRETVSAKSLPIVTPSGQGNFVSKWPVNQEHPVASSIGTTRDLAITVKNKAGPSSSLLLEHHGYPRCQIHPKDDRANDKDGDRANSQLVPDLTKFEPYFFEFDGSSANIAVDRALTKSTLNVEDLNLLSACTATLHNIELNRFYYMISSKYSFDELYRQWKKFLQMSTEKDQLGRMKSQFRYMRTDTINKMIMINRN